MFWSSLSLLACLLLIVMAFKASHNTKFTTESYDSDSDDDDGSPNSTLRALHKKLTPPSTPEKKTC